MTSALLLSFLVQTLVAATPLLLAALGEILSERVGVINISLEGMLLLGCLAAVVVSVATGQPWLGVLAAIVAGTVGAAIFALYGIALKRDQVIVGTTLNFLALGLTGMFYRAWSGSGSVKLAPTLPAIAGTSGTALNGLTVVALLLVPVAQYLLYRTRLGVILRAVGEKPAAAAASGSRVNRLRIVTTLVCGALCGAGGASLSIGISNTFTEGMTAGRGFIALAIVVFGRWSPLGALSAALLFAAADVAQARLQTVSSLSIPYPIFLAVPYLFTLLALALRGAKSRPPTALGMPFDEG